MKPHTLLDQDNNGYHYIDKDKSYGLSKGDTIISKNKIIVKITMKKEDLFFMNFLPAKVKNRNINLKKFTGEFGFDNFLVSSQFSLKSTKREMKDKKINTIKSTSNHRIVQDKIKFY
jgi:hypothetical protein